MASTNQLSNDGSGSGNVGRNPLHESWHDPAWIPSLNTHNVMDYFSERTNPFYDRTCNNEVLKMQRVGMQGPGPIDQHLPSMTGIEYILLCAQEPILYVIRKQQRHSPTQVTTLADYYIVAGVVYQVTYYHVSGFGNLGYFKYTETGVIIPHKKFNILL